MQMGVTDILEPLRQPEYTGANRCVPCTAVNVCLAITIAAGLFLLSPLVSGVFLGVALGLIYLRGYLVPGTPTLTKQYFPTRLLRLFGKTRSSKKSDAVETSRRQRSEEQTTEVSPSGFLQETGVLRACENVDDVCLTAEFREAWENTIETMRDTESNRDQLVTLLLGAHGSPSYTVEYDTTVSVKHDEQTVGTWESEAAFLSDIAAAAVLNEREPQWQTLAVETRGEVAASLRMFLEECPACGSTLSFKKTESSACCWSRDVVTLRCDRCQSTLLEVDELTFDDGTMEFI